jgi:hypothetical protein
MAEDAVLPRHYEVGARIATSAGSLFDFLDDPARLTDHMSKSTWMMGGGRMRLELDESEGRRVGSKMTLSGRAFGLELFLEQAVTERSVPHRKTWQTSGTPHLWVIAQYRLGFEINSQPDGTWVRVFIDYALPESGFGHWLGLLFGNGYAKWCTRRMLGDARAHFTRVAAGPQEAS